MDMNIRDTLHKIHRNIYKAEYNSFSRKARNQYDPDSEEWSQHTITPRHNYHYHSGKTKQHIYGYVGVTKP
jgi:cell division protein FtsI/penicillin-binding protein 2